MKILAVLVILALSASSALACSNCQAVICNDDHTYCQCN